MNNIANILNVLYILKQNRHFLLSDLGRLSRNSFFAIIGLLKKNHHPNISFS